jgi:VanZ family protein
MRRPGLDRNFLIITAMIAAVIVYGSLYPFTFRHAAGNSGPLRRLLQSWLEWHGRVDFLSNVLLYMPFGGFAGLAANRIPGRPRRVGLVILVGAWLSVLMELAQYFVPGRGTTAIDVYSNVLGTGLGAVAAAYIFPRQFRAGITGGREVPVLLLLVWLGYQLFRFLVPGNAPGAGSPLRAALSGSGLSAHALLQETALWSATAALLGVIIERRRSWLWFPLLAGAVLAARQLAVGSLGAAELLGAGFAWAGQLFAAHRRSSALAVAALLVAGVIDQPFASFQSGAQVGHFTWIPFAGFLHGSLRYIAAFLQRAFQLGSAIWLLGRAGLRPWLGATLVTVGLLFAELAASCLASRPGGLTDAMMAAMVGASIALMTAGSGSPPIARAACPAAAGLREIDSQTEPPR